MDPSRSALTRYDDFYGMLSDTVRMEAYRQASTDLILEFRAAMGDDVIQITNGNRAAKDPAFAALVDGSEDQISFVSVDIVRPAGAEQLLVGSRLVAAEDLDLARATAEKNLAIALTQASSDEWLALVTADLAQVIETNGGRADVLGHSMGGKCAMQFALSFPDRVDKLVVVDIAPGEYKDPSWNRYLTTMLSVDPTELSSRKEGDELLKEQIPSVIYRQFLLSNLVNDADGTYRWRPNLSAILSAQDDIAAPVNGPASDIDTLFVRGSESNYVRNEDLQVIRELFPNSSLTTVADCGHLVHIEARDRFNQLLLDFL